MNDITTLLGRWQAGDRRALRELFPLVYAELHRIAKGAMARERQSHTLQATALVHEAYLRLMGGAAPQLENRGHFFALIARLMRRVLVDHARALQAVRRGGDALRITLDGLDVAAEPEVGLLDLDRAISALAAVDRRKARVVELRFFGGLDVEETAAVLGVSAPTVISDTRFARAWLYAHLAGESLA